MLVSRRVCVLLSDSCHLLCDVDTGDRPAVGHDSLRTLVVTSGARFAAWIYR